jgi:hypothetical protein
MQYMLLIYSDPAAMQAMNQEKIGQMAAAFNAYTEALKKEGAWTGGDRLRPASDARVGRAAGGKTSVLNGPYAETREHLGGYYLIDVPDLDTAIKWAARCPGASNGTMEVRPVWTM